jgi:hypothetical protein
MLGKLTGLGEIVTAGMDAIFWFCEQPPARNEERKNVKPTSANHQRLTFRQASSPSI